MQKNNNILKKVLEKFNYPESLIKEYNHWYWLIRTKQITLGSGILINKSHFSHFYELPEDAFLELKIIINEIEKKLYVNFNCYKVNYLMLMMQDPTVHFHVIPRYSKEVKFNNFMFYDKGYPGIPNFDFVNDIDKSLLINIKNVLS